MGRPYSPLTLPLGEGFLIAMSNYPLELDQEVGERWKAENPALSRVMSNGQVEAGEKPFSIS